MKHRALPGILRSLAELVVVGMGCLAPWAFGSVDAWAEFALHIGTATVVTLVAVADGTTPRARRLFCLPSVGLAGLVLVALIQMAPLPPALGRWAAPAADPLRAKLTPPTAERVLGDVEPPVPLPPARLSQDPYQTSRMAVRLAGGWLLLQGVLGLPAGTRAARRLIVALVANAAAMSLVSIVQLIAWNGKLLWIRPVVFGDAWSVGGPFDHHTHLSESLNMGLCLGLGPALVGGWRGFFGSRSIRPLAAYACVVIAAGVLASGSRGGFLVLLFGGSGIALWSRRTAARLLLGIAAAVALLLILLLLAAWGLPLSALGRLATIFDLGNHGYAVRLDLWRAALRAWWDHPIWGTGLGSFPVGSMPFVSGRYGSFFARAENEPLDLLSEGGLVGVCLLLLAGAGVWRLARKALASSATPEDHVLMVGIAFALLSLGLNSLGDFGPHVAGVGVPALILVATLCRAGLCPDRPGSGPTVRGSTPARVGWAFCGLAMAVTGLALARHASADAEVEAVLARVNLPGPGGRPPLVQDFARDRAGLVRQGDALEAAVRLRPDWAEGHLSLGLVDLLLFAGGSDEAGRTLDLVSLHHATRYQLRVRSGPGPRPGPTLRGPESAARHFLEARRACPYLPTTQVELASLADILQGDSAATYAGRAARLAGGQREVLILAAEIAADAGDPSLAARCWRRSLELSPEEWEGVADAASKRLAPDRILREVVPTGRLALRFAEVFAPPLESVATRDLFLREAIRRLPGDPGLAPAERLELEARAWAALGNLSIARSRMESALSSEPENFTRRRQLIDWLLQDGELDEAHEQAKIGLYFAPGSRAAVQSLEATAEAMARRPPLP